MRRGSREGESQDDAESNISRAVVLCKPSRTKPDEFCGLSQKSAVEAVTVEVKT